MLLVNLIWVGGSSYLAIIGRSNGAATEDNDLIVRKEMRIRPRQFLMRLFSFPPGAAVELSCA